MREEKIDKIVVSELNILELKELMVLYERLVRSKDKKMAEKAKKTLVMLMDKMDKAVKNGIVSGAEYSQKIILKLGEKSKKYKGEK